MVDRRAEGLKPCGGRDADDGRAHRVAGAGRGRRAEGRGHGAGAGHRRRVDLRAAARKAMGATVTARSSSDAKIERLRKLEADHMIDDCTTPDWGERVRALTDGRGADHVVEVGGPGTLPQSITAVRIGGHIALIGVLTGRAGEVPTGALMAKQAKLQGLIVGSRCDQIEMVRAIESTGLHPVIDRSFSLDDIADAFRLEESQHHFGKICLEV